MSEILYSTIEGESVFEFEEKRSVFIGYASNVSSEEEARSFIQRIKSKHYDARHNCSAYILRNGVMRYSDDGEPQGTAGIPMLEVLKKSGIVDVVVVVTRYFGGVLLGAGGLVRAYSSACAGAIGEAEKADYQKCVLFSIIVEYSLYDKLTRHILSKGARVRNTDYNDKIEIEGVIPADEYTSFVCSVVDQFSGKISVDQIDEIIEKI